MPVATPFDAPPTVKCRECEHDWALQTWQSFGGCPQCTTKGPPCPQCKRPLLGHAFQCGKCEESIEWRLRTEALRQDAEIDSLRYYAKLDRKFRNIHAAMPAVYELLFPEQFIDTMPEHERFAFRWLCEELAGSVVIYQTGSRFICPWAVSDKSDWDVMLLASGDCEQLLLQHGLQFQERGEGSNPDPDGGSYRYGRLNAIVFYAASKYAPDHLDAWKAATVWCRFYERQYDLREDRVGLFDTAVGEEWQLPEISP